MTVPPRYRLTAALGALMLAAAAAILWEGDFGRALQRETVIDVLAANRRTATLDVKLTPAFGLKPIDEAYKETAERPLFIWTRRPAPPAAASTPQVVMKKGQFRLAGTSVSDGLSVAYLVELASNKTLRITQGSEVNGIRLETVGATSVLLKQGDDSEELVLKTAASPKAPAAPGTPGAPAMAAVPGAPPAVGGLAGVAPALPGVPGGNFGPSLPGAAAAVAAAQPGAVPSPPVARNPADPAATANTINNSNDPNAQSFRRRRFQNLPQ